MGKIERKSIPELMDGRYFYIPDYQRGYRWTPKQVEDLLRDLFVYAKGNVHNASQVDNGDYYCLQPIVAREISNPKEKKDLGIPSGQSAWEIVDGQQRLTTIYILYQYLMNKKGITPNTLLTSYYKQLYRIIYATRTDSTKFLGSLGGANMASPVNNIDFYHMSQAFDTIDKWIHPNPATAANSVIYDLCKRYHIKFIPATVIDILWDLLNAEKGYVSPIGTVQVLWYELDPGKNVIQEFRETNTNQIRLTDAELIKALFLRKSSCTSIADLLNRSNQWESIENTLQVNPFWYFLNKRGHDLPSRINLLFMLRYQLEELKKPTSVSIEACLNACEKNLETKDFLFDYFNKKFDGLSPNDLAQKTEKEWQAILTIFHTLEDWFNDAICYNLIGLLSQFDNSQLAKYYYKFDTMNVNGSREDFKQYLKDCIREQFKNLKYDKDGTLSLNYKRHRSMIFNLLLLLNISHLNKQAEGAISIIQSGEIYKFPFDVLLNDWDIEHIDSFTTNPLKDATDMNEWINVALSDLKLDDATRDKIKNLQGNGTNVSSMEKAISELKRIAGEDDTMSDDRKNNISNLTLLDAETNRSYGNSLFVTKRKKIIERMKSGQYVPVTTTFVFMKLFDESGTSRSLWREEDMIKYHDYICKELTEYLP